jgi:hypothetical protein
VAAQRQCDNCGAILLKEDLFCGECGAPSPPTAGSVDPVETQPMAAAEPTPTLPPFVQPPPPSAQPALSPARRWRTAFIVLVVLAVTACMAGIIAFLIFGSMESEATTPAEDWLFSAICCLLPIGGTGALLGGISGIIWYARLREQ